MASSHSACLWLRKCSLHICLINTQLIATKAMESDHTHAEKEVWPKDKFLHVFSLPATYACSFFF